jgi:hypothetical protein
MPDFGQTFKRFEPGRSYPAEELNRLVEAVEALLRDRREPLFSTGMESLAGRVELEPQGFWAKIVSTDNQGAYGWVEQCQKSDGTFADQPGGVLGTVLSQSFQFNPAYEQNGNKNVPVNTVVWMRYGAFHSTKGQLFAFDSLTGACIAVQVCVGGVATTKYLRLTPAGFTLTDTAC